MMHARGVWVVAGLMCGLLACGEKEEVEETPPPPSYEFETAEEFFPAQIALEARVRCEAMFTCPARQLDMLSSYGGASDQAKCVEAFLDSGLVALERELVTGGRLAYDQAIGDTCHKVWKEAEMWGLCDLNALEASKLETSCEGIFSGTVEEEGDCLIDLECVDGLTCEGEVSEDSCYSTCIAGPCGICAEDEYCNGDACVPRLGENRICLSTAQCEQGLVCNDETFMCEPPAPAPVEPEPELPEIAPPGDPCRDQGQAPLIMCRPGTVCLPSDMPGMNTCQSPRKKGSSCQFDEQCALGLRCDYDFDLDEGTCVTSPDPAGLLMCEES